MNLPRTWFATIQVLLLQLAGVARRWAQALVVPRPLVGAIYLPRYIGHWISYRNRSKGNIPRFVDSYPCLSDWTHYTPFDPHYFYQGAWLSRRLQKDNHGLHVDIASSVLTVSTLSAQVDTIFVDYRPIRTSLTGLIPVAGSIVRLPFASSSIQSLSCLHVIEHIGLGRYGDPIDPEGSIEAARELSRVLGQGGYLYISVPVGRERIEFNAHRIFDPETIITLFGELRLVEFSFVDDAGMFHEGMIPAHARGNSYACGMYEFRK